MNGTAVSSPKLTMLPNLSSLTPRSSDSSSSIQSTEKADNFAARAEAVLRSEVILTKVPFVGRDDEFRRLETVVDEMLSRADEKGNRVVCISGPAGVGKTTLAVSLRRKVTENNGFFIEGKFDHRNQRAEVYTGISKALQDLTTQILDRDLDMSIRRRLQEAIGPDDADVLAEIFPALSRVLPVAKEEHKHDSESNRAKRRQFLFQRFFRAVSSSMTYRDEDLEPQDSSESDRDHEPESNLVVLFLDDVQWIDQPSLDLVSALVRDGDLGSLLLVTTNRQFDPTGHPFEEEQLRWESQDVPIDMIELQPLDIACVRKIVTTLLREDEEETKPLVDLIHKKTLGSPFFVLESVKLLIDHEAMTYSYSRMRWIWDIAKVRSILLTSNDLTSILTKKLEKLAPFSQLSLLVGSSLGVSFDKSTMEVIMRDVDGAEILPSLDTEVSVSSVQDTLTGLVAQGVLDGNSDEFRFTHDITKQAVVQSVSSNMYNLLKLRVGQSVLRGLDRNALESSLIYTGVDLCTSAVNLLDYRAKMQLARHSLGASEKAMRESAFTLALRYATFGISIARENAVFTDPGDADLYNNLLVASCEAAYCRGDFEIVRQNTQLLEGSVVSQSLLLRCMFLRIQVAMSMMQSDEALDLGVETLKMLGVKSVPRHPSKMTVGIELMKTKRALKGLTREALCSLPELEDENRIAAMHCIDLLQNAAFIANPNFFLVIFLTSMRWSVKYGITKFSPALFAVYGTIQVGLFLDIGGGVAFGEVALELSDRLGVKETRAKATMNVFTGLRPWSHGMRSCYSPLVYSHKLAMECGDTETALVCLLHIDSIVWCTSKFSLKVLAKEMYKHCRLCREIENYQILNGLFVISKGLRQLGCHEDFSWIDRMGDVKVDDSDQSKAFADVFNLQSSYLLGDISESVIIAKRTKEVGSKVLLSLPFVPRAHFYRGLSFLSDPSRENLRELKSVIQLMETWVAGGNPNCRHMLLLLQAEFARVGNQNESASELYSKAIREATRSGHDHDLGICHECAGRFHLEKDDHQWAEHHIKQAARCFTKWGAEAKVRQLRDEYSHFVEVTEFFVPPR